ncbi:MAG: class I SAM-dependent methyltransferase [SAR202 cluster bacterium]|nr:class I SAM-dependent methyltransferase [SAR202 cluster bacterium]
MHARPPSPAAVSPRTSRRRCPACDSQRSPKPARPRLGTTGELFHFARCGDCGLMFVTDPMPEQHTLSVSTGRPWDPASLPAPRFRPGHFYFAAAITTYVRRAPEPVSLLDVGCGGGELGMLLARANADKLRYVGAEPVPNKAGLARARGIEVLELTADQVAADPAQAGRWDVVVLDNVLEHLVSPLDAVRGLRGLLKPGGVFMIAVPNLRDVRRLTQRRFPLWIPNVHINYFTNRSLRRLCRLAGLTPGYLHADLRGLPLRARLGWGGKQLLERLLGLSPRGLYIVARNR